jgi:hypothetical protein
LIGRACPGHPWLSALQHFSTEKKVMDAPDEHGRDERNGDSTISESSLRGPKRFRDRASLPCTEIRVLRSTSARAIRAMMDLIEWPDATVLANSTAVTGFSGYNVYEETATLDLRRGPCSGCPKFPRPSRDWLSEDVKASHGG